MKIKKTIAAIAALTMALSSLPVMAFANGDVSDGSAVTEPTDTENPGGQGDEPTEEDNPNDGIALYAAGNSTDHATETTMGVDNAEGTSIGNVTKGQNGTDYHVAVKLSAPNSTVNGCHVVIPVDGLTSSWIFDGGYIFDNNENHSWNIDNGYLRLWLTGTDRTYNIKLKNGSETKTVHVTFDSSTAPGALSAAVDGSPVTNVTKEDNTVTVVLPEGAVGKTEDGSGNANGSRKDYYLVIPVADIDSSWTFKSGWGYDETNHHEFNISNGALKLWVPVGDDTTHTIVLTNGTTDKTIIIKTNPAVVTPPEEDWTAKTAGVYGITGGTGTVTKTDGANGAIDVTVTLTPATDGGTITGKPQQGDGVQNYYVVISGLGTDTSWTLSPGGADGGQYGYDEADHTYNVDANGNLRLWLPVAPAAGKDTCKVVLTKGADKKIVNVKTVVLANKTPGKNPHTDVYPEVWTDAGDGVYHTKACTVTGCNNFQRQAHTMTWTGGGEIQTGTCSGCGCITTRANPDYVAPSTPAPSYIPNSSGTAATVTTTTVTSTTVSTPAQVRTSSKSNITINAAETKVTPAIIKAFTKNKKAKTLTVSYGTKMKIAIKKSDVKDASANLDFSVSGKSFLSGKIKNSSALAKAKKITQIDFVKTGKLDGVSKVTVQSRVGSKYVGRKATVYEYVNGKLVKVAKTTVGGSGLVNFNIDHYGQYVIAVE